MKTLKQILEVYSPKSADEKRFVNKHIVVKTPDVAGNGDDVYSGAKVKEIDRKTTRKGYNTKDSESVYEGTYNADVERAFPASGVKTMSPKKAPYDKEKTAKKIGAAMDKATDAVQKGRAERATARAIAKMKYGMKEEVEQMDEVLKVSSGAGAWIKDFQDSDNPKFAGKSKEQRKQQALAAFYAAKRSGKE